LQVEGDPKKMAPKMRNAGNGFSPARACEIKRRIAEWVHHEVHRYANQNTTNASQKEKKKHKQTNRQISGTKVWNAETDSIQRGWKETRRYLLQRRSRGSDESSEEVCALTAYL
jgi:hypothetical protein